MKYGTYVSPAGHDIEFPRGHKVCVRASYNPDGNVHMHAWGIEYKGIRYRYTVISAEMTEEVHAYLTFRCCYEEFGFLKSINLVFLTREHRWITG